KQQRPNGIHAGVDRLGADLDAVFDQEGFQARIDKRRQRGGKVGHLTRFDLGAAAFFGVAFLMAGRRVDDRLLDLARNGIAAAIDLLDVAVFDLLFKKGVGYRDGFRPGEQRLYQQVVAQQDQQEPEPDGAWRTGGGRPAAAGGRASGPGSGSAAA